MLAEKNQGQRNGNARLSEDEVRSIREHLETKTMSAPALARIYGMSAEAIRRIGRRETWGWLTEGAKLNDPEVTAGAAASLTRLQKLLAEQPPASAAEKMAASIAEAKEKAGRGDALLTELTTGEKK